MYIVDSETRKDGVNYKLIGAQAEDDGEFLYYAQPIDSMLEAQKQHDANLNALLDSEEDLMVREATLEPDYTQA